MTKRDLAEWASAAPTGTGEEVLVLSKSLASAIRGRWHAGERPDVAAVLEKNPGLRQCRSVVLSLAYEEYRLRRQGGEALTAQEFAQRFPSLERSLYLLIEVHELLSHDPEFQMLQGNFAWPEAGHHFLQFDLIAELGRGTFGRVYLASEPALGSRLVVVKIAPHGGKEADILGQLSHANIVPIHSVNEDDVTGLTAFCMPYLGRATLNDVLDRVFVALRSPRHARVILDAVRAVQDNANGQETVPPDRFLLRCSYVDGILHLACQIADALAYSHNRGIRHCDLKPSNVLMTSAGRPLLLDFNLSVDERFSVCKTGGTLPYMAPEELVAFAELKTAVSRHHFDPRSDLFSLGVMIYELFTGHLPFGTPTWDESFVETARRLYQRQVDGAQPLRTWNARVDPRVARLVESCLAFDPEDRPETAAALADALRRELTWRRRSSRWIRDHQGIVSALAATMLALVVVVGGLVISRPAYKVREFRTGVALAQEGRSEAAIDHFSNAIRSDPKYYDALVARGSARQRSGEFAMAFDDYQSAYQLMRSSTLEVCMGYCLSRMNQYKAAVSAYQAALDSGEASTTVLNNLGAGYRQLKRSTEAAFYLRQAIQKGDCFQTPYCNLLLVYRDQALRGRTIPSEAITYARRALEMGPPSAELYRDLAELYALLARHDSTFAPQAIEYVRQAVECGVSPESLRSNSVFSALSKKQSFLQALATNRCRNYPPLEYLLSPLEHP